VYKSGNHPLFNSILDIMAWLGWAAAVLIGILLFYAILKNIKKEGFAAWAKRLAKKEGDGRSLIAALLVSSFVAFFLIAK